MDCFLNISWFIHTIHYLLQDHVFELIQPFRDFKTIWQIRIEASRALLDLEFHCKGMDAALSLFITYLEEEPSLRGSALFVMEKKKRKKFFWFFCMFYLSSWCPCALFVSFIRGLLYLVAGQAKLGAHAMRLCQIQDESDSEDSIKCTTLLALIRLLEGHIGFNNTILRHHLFCILQILAGRWVPISSFPSYGLSFIEVITGWVVQPSLTSF